MDQDKMDGAVEKFRREFGGRPVWVDGVEKAVIIAEITDSGKSDPAPFGAEHPAILVKYRLESPKNPLFGTPRGQPGVPIMPGKYEGAAVHYLVAE